MAPTPPYARRAPAKPGRSSIIRELLQRRKGGGEDDLVLLRDQAVAAAAGGPHALLARLVADLHALVHARVGPDVHEAVGLAELHASGEHDRRELDALGQLGLPAVGRGGQRAALEGVVADLVD